MDIYLPAAKLSRGNGVPEVCLPHARPAVTYRPVTLASRPAPWMLPFLIVPAALVLVLLFAHVMQFGPAAVGIATIVFTGVYRANRKVVRAPRWPLCEACVARSRHWSIVGWSLIALGGAGLVITIALIPNGQYAWSMLTGLTSFLAILVGAGLRGAGRMTGLPHGFVDQQGEYVRIVRVSEEFREADKRTRTRQGKRRGAKPTVG
jgi:hypothetical protein